MAQRHAFMFGIVLLAVVLTTVAHAQDEQSIIKEIKFEGRVRTRESIIRPKINSRVGRPLSHDEIVADQKRLMETGYFSDVIVRTKAEEDGVILTFSFIEKPTLNDVNVIGNRKIKTSKILKKVFDKIGRGELFNELELYDAEKDIEDMYKKKGFFDVIVETRAHVDVNRNEVNIEIVIDEGEPGFVKEITFEGRQSIEAKKLLKVMQTKKRKFLPFLFGKGELKRDVLEEDKERIAAVYRNTGFLDAKVTGTRIERSGKDNKNLHVIVEIEEGPQYIAGKITIAGNEAFTTEELENGRRLSEGDVLSLSTAEKERVRLRDFYSENGYIDVRVDRQFRPTEKQNVLTVTYTITEGHKIRIGKIEIIGNVVTRDKVIRRELPMFPGEMYDGVKIRVTRSRLLQLNYFSRVDVYPVETGTPDVRDLIIEVEERNTGMLTFGAGFSSIDNLVGGFKISQSNFDIRNWPKMRGGGQKAHLEVSVGSKKQEYVLSFVEPWLFGQRLRFGIDLFKNKNKYASDVYSFDSYGFRLKLFKQLIRNVQGGVTYKWVNTDVKPEEDASEAIQAEAGERITSSMRFDLIYDTRDSIRLPTRGWRNTAYFEYAGGVLAGDTDFTREGIEIVRYIRMPMFERHVLRLRGEYGTMEEFGDSTHIPIFERFFLGGRTSVRGYDYHAIGPLDETGEPLGGKSSALLSAEYTFPIYQDILRGATFYDTGQVWSDSYELNLDDLQAGWGVGLRIIIPQLGIPVNLDYSWPLDAGPFDDEGGRFDFSLGFTF